MSVPAYLATSSIALEMAPRGTWGCIWIVRLGFGFGLGIGIGLRLGLGLGLGLDPNLHERAAQLLHVEGRQLEPLGEGVHELDDHELQPGGTLQLGRQVDAWLGLG